MDSRSTTATAVNADLRTPDRTVAYEREQTERLDNLMWSQLVTAIDEAGQPKPTLAEMLAWADAMENRERAAVHRACMINGYVPQGTARPLAAARRLVLFLEWCADNTEDIATLVRAKAHAKRRRG